MSKLAVLAWVVVVGCVAAASISLIARPLHWERTFALALVLGIAAVFLAIRQSRRGKTA